MTMTIQEYLLLLCNIYLQYTQLSMNLNQIILSFSDLFKAKKVGINHLQTIIQDFYKITNKVPFSQKLSIISTIVYFFQEALKTQNSLTEKFKYQVFYGALRENGELKRRSGQTTKKNLNRNGQKKKADITINQILEQAVSDGLTQLDNSIAPQLVIKQAQILKKDQIVLPPFEPQTIPDLVQDINALLKTPQKQGQMAEWQPSKLQNYQKWLALTQKGISIAYQPRQPKTKKKHPQRQQVQIDDRIDISQGLSQIQLLQNLATKVKASRHSLQRQNTFENRINNINVLLNNVNKANNLLLLKNQFLKLQKSGTKQKSFQSQPNYNEPDLKFYTIHQNKSQQSSSFASQTKKSNLLQQKLTLVLKQSFVKTKKVTFRNICKQKSIESEQKGQIFYQLLHLKFKLQQKEVERFGDILIFGGE